MRAVTAAPAGLTPSLLSLIKRAGAFCFDVDSTVITTEGIDELASFAGKRAEVSALTASAMGGATPFHEALDARLRLIAPTAPMLSAFLAAHPFSLTPGVSAVVARLHARGARVYLVSGGFTQMIHPVADALAIPRDRVFANTILFHAGGGGGGYAGVDPEAPTRRDGGKAVALARIKAAHGHAEMVMVGDGATDLQAKPPADAVLGFGGVVERDAVRKGACWFFKDFEKELLPLL
jgi:phosphoserine phosphatase